MALDFSPDLQALKDQLLAALRAEMPQPATVVPTAINDMGAKGSATAKFALEDHTHKSSFQAQETLVVGGAGQFTWVFDQAFAAGVVPICGGTALVTRGATQGYIVNVIDGSQTNTQVEYLIFKTQTQTLSGVLTSVLGAVLNFIGIAPNGVKVNCFARLPSVPTP